MPKPKKPPTLKPAKDCVLVRMYRIGHGDCFLLVLPRKGGGTPVYVMIDCGYKPGSPEFIHTETIDDVVAQIAKDTGKKLDLVVLTHEHQDHLNGIWKKNDPYFGDFAIHECWLAWTEDPDDDVANDLRRRHHDQLLGLVAARNKLALAAAPNDDALSRVNSLLSLELGSEVSGNGAVPLAAAENLEASVNKQGLKLMRDAASKHQGVSYLTPGQKALTIPGTDGIRAYVLGPPRDPDLIADEDPQGSEAFPDDNAFNISFGGAAQNDPSVGCAPFNTRFCTPLDEALEAPFLSRQYGRKGDGIGEEEDKEVAANAKWRRIDEEWLYSAENLALKLNTGINNTSLVLAIELPKSKKVLLFAADAQRGNWKSWTDHEWKEGTEKITVKDLLGRTVLYKVGHHGSHNATLAGTTANDYANLGWMATGSEAAGEFTAMITAVNKWALTKNHPPWRHPLPSIREALDRKAQGRVFQTDIDQPEKPTDVPAAAWKKFTDRSAFETLYFDYSVKDG